ncbi:MAG TPA: helicase-related protein [Spirochaetia bacterium]|nr:helicase-related protein [Spirochaetia bacterium]
MKAEIDRQICSSEYALENLDQLPVANLRHSLRQEIRQHPNFVLIGETGSGKTTCLPPLLLEMKNELSLSGTIAVTQPRKLATKSVTSRVSSMMQYPVGEKVGYHIRFEDITTDETDITFMTDGILLRKIQFDPLLLDYSIVMVDEAHEQSTNIVLCLGLLKDVNKRRNLVNVDPIRIIVTSATIERNKFADYISYGDKNNSIEIPGKMYPVEVFYEDETPFNYDFTKGAAEKVKGIIDNHLAGDILIFMPGKKEISDTIDNILGIINQKDVEIMPLHAEMSPEDQDKILISSSKRKIIVATNIAETSITIDGVIHVIDSGLIKQTQFDPRSGIEQLVLTEHAISGLDQRKGRAGRTAPGFCYRLYTEESLRRRPQYQTPEIQRSNLSQVVLAMKKVGIENVNDFDFLDHPGKKALVHAVDLLTSLGALDHHGEITEIGDWMVELAVEPCLGRMIIEALRPEIDCVNEIVIIASFLDGKKVFLRPSERDEEILADRAHSQFKKNTDSDFTVFLNIWKAYAASGYDSEWAKRNYLNEKVLEEAKNVRLDILDVLASHGINVDPNEKPKIKKDAIHKAIAAGFMGNLMKNCGKSGLCKVDGTKNNIGIHPSSMMFNNLPSAGSYIIASEIFINPYGKAYACNCLEVKRDWLKDIAPELIYQGNSRHKGREKRPSRSDRHSRSHNRR